MIGMMISAGTHATIVAMKTAVLPEEIVAIKGSDHLGSRSYPKENTKKSSHLLRECR
jgi:hypothetical protein